MERLTVRSNYPGFFPPRSILPPPLVYARFGSIPKTVKNKRKLVPAAVPQPHVKASRRSEVGLRPPRRSAFMIQRSTRIYGAPRSGYFFEKSEVEIRPMNDIFEEKKFSLKNLFDAIISRGGSTLRGVERGRENAGNGEAREENARRLLAILKGGGRRDASETYDAVSRKNADPFRGRRKREIGEKEETGTDLGGESAARRNPTYTPVLKECDDAAASEVSDLNAAAPLPSGRRRSSLREYNHRSKDPLPDIDFSRRKHQLEIKENEEEANVGATTSPPAPVAVSQAGSESPKESTRNETYINLRDHQLDSQAGTTPKDPNGYPLDIPAYDPDIIPYVDVPDYSDQREESLDKDDRRVAKDKYAEDPNEDADVIDPEAPLDGEEKRLEEIVVRQDESAAPVDDGAKGEGDVGEPQTRDREDVEEEPEALREEKEEEEEVEGKEEEQTATKEEVKESESDFTPINFDIDEYKKPFNLEELFKEVRREAEATQKQKNATKGDVNEHQGSRNVPVREDGPYEALEVPSGKKSNADSEKINAAIDTRNFFEEFDRIFDPATSENPFLGYFEEEEDAERDPASSSVQENSENLNSQSYRDEDTYDRLFGGKNAGDKYPSKEADDKARFEAQSEEAEEDFFAKLKSADVKSSEPENESLREAFVTLGTILAKKDDVSRLDDAVVERVKKEGKMPDKYNNYWTLEYGTPRKGDKT